MIIEAYILTYNESDIIGLIIKHYQKFCNKVILMDNYSSDTTCQIAESMGCEVRKFGTQFFDDAENMKCKNNCWKGSQADWVIVCDADEVLFSGTVYPTTKSVVKLQHDKGASIIKTYGWQVMSDSMPKDDLLEITNGYHFANYSKSILFSPKHIQEINYNPGAHKCHPIGNVVWSDETLYVLHYKHIGGIQRTIDRYKAYKKRLSSNNIRNGWGIHYNRSIPSLIEEWNERMLKSKPLI